jgi:hypothetical protein
METVSPLTLAFSYGVYGVITVKVPIGITKYKIVTFHVFQESV